MRTLTLRDFGVFIASRPVTVIHFDAGWDNYRDNVRAQMIDAENSLKEFAAFAEVDCGAQGDLCKTLGVANIPCIAYFREGTLASLGVGTHQDIREETERLLKRDL